MNPFKKGQAIECINACYSLPKGAVVRVERVNKYSVKVRTPDGLLLTRHYSRFVPASGTAGLTGFASALLTALTA